jgi:prepilin-type N-terminal cleavage/methylation domain-containing protein
VKTCSRKRPELGVVPLKADVLRRLVAPQLDRGKSLREDRLTLLKLCRRSCAFTLPKPGGRSTLRSRRAVVFSEGGFTLLELLVVMAIIVLLLAMVVPAVTSLSKSNGRKAAIANLLGGIEQARAQAIADTQATYVVFATFGIGTSQAILDRYNYKSYAIFEDDSANPGAVKQLTPWRTLPTGVSLRANQGSGFAITNLVTPAALPAPTPSFSFTPNSSSSPTFYLIKFNTAGELDTPAANVVLGLFEGFVSSGNETFTCAKDKNGNPFASEYLSIAEHTGRAEPTATPTP